MAATRIAIATIVIAIGVIVIAVLAAMYSGLYNVAARYEHPAPVEWFLHTTYDHSVAARADQIEVPTLERAERVDRGARHYLQTCRVCHTPPGGSPSEISRGLRPSPPDLDKILARHRTPAGAFWVIANGLRMTGMPAFGPTHDDNELWDIVAFLKRAKGISPGEYRKLLERAQTEDAGTGHGDEPDALATNPVE